MRITARGTGLVVAALALLGTGFRLGYPELTVVGVAAVVALLFALLHAAWRPRLSVTRRADPDRVERGEPSRVVLDVRNDSRLRGANLVAYDRCGTRQVPVPLLRLGAGRSTTVEYPVPTDRRGVVTVGPLRVLRRDPLGLLTLRRSHGGTSTIWVYPRIWVLTAVPVGIARSLDGRVDRVPQGSITFDTLREYVIGDELRHVHWRTSARVGELMVREHVDTSLPRLVVLLDDRRSAYADPEHFEPACEAAASIVVAAARDELPLVLRTVSGGAAGGSATAGGGSAGTGAGGAGQTGGRPLDLLAEAVLGDADLAAVTAGLRLRRVGDTLIFLTGAPGAVDLADVGALRGAYPSIVVAAFGGSDPVPSTMDGLLILNASDGAEFARAWDGVRRW